MDTIRLNSQFAICIIREKDEDLEVWKLYRILPDQKASEVWMFASD